MFECVSAILESCVLQSMHRWPLMVQQLNFGLSITLVAGVQPLAKQCMHVHPVRWGAQV